MMIQILFLFFFNCFGNCSEYNFYYLELQYAKYNKILDPSFFSFDKDFKRDVQYLKRKLKKNTTLDPGGFFYLSLQTQLYEASARRLIKFNHAIDVSLLDGIPQSVRPQMTMSSFFENLKKEIPQLDMNLFLEWTQWRGSIQHEAGLKNLKKQIVELITKHKEYIKYLKEDLQYRKKKFPTNVGCRIDDSSPLIF